MTSDTAEPAAAGFGFGPYQVGPEVQAGLVQLAGRGPKAVQYTEVDGQAVFEGDIILDLIESKQIAGDQAVALLESGVLIPGQQFRWPSGLVPYEIDAALPDQSRVTGAIDHWQRNTRIRFVRRTAQNQGQYPDFIRFVPGSGCSSAVGLRGNVQQITLGSGCELGAAIHEIGHATGLWHEQSREDRDQFVTINWANIQQGMAHNFNQHITDGDDVGAYDYHSIMHYPRWAFSNNGQDTIVPRQTVETGQRQGLSPGDCLAVRTMYASLESPARFSGVQFTGQVAAGQVGRWFTHSWPAHWYVHWTVVPTGPVADGDAQIESWVQVTRQSGGLLKYFVNVRNLTGGPVDIQARYDVLGWGANAT